jgi:hypothetical protein
MQFNRTSWSGVSSRPTEGVLAKRRGILSNPGLDPWAEGQVKEILGRVFGRLCSARDYMNNNKGWCRFLILAKGKWLLLNGLSFKQALGMGRRSGIIRTTSPPSDEVCVSNGPELLAFAFDLCSEAVWQECQDQRSHLTELRGNV